MSIILKDHLWKLLKDRELIVTPLLDRDQVRESSIDVRLGNQFIVINRTRLLGLDLAHYDGLARQLHKYHTRIRIEYGERFILHPGQLVLGATLEYLKLPRSLSGYLIGRSSWGRMGLVIATATNIGPGYTGSPTLELINLGEIPLTVYPGVRIAQLVLHTGIGNAYYKGKHRCATEPEFSKLFQDADLKYWVNWVK